MNDISLISQQIANINQHSYFTQQITCWCAQYSKVQLQLARAMQLHTKNDKHINLQPWPSFRWEFTVKN